MCLGIVIHSCALVLRAKTRKFCAFIHASRLKLYCIPEALLLAEIPSFLPTASYWPGIPPLIRNWITITHNNRRVGVGVDPLTLQRSSCSCFHLPFVILSLERAPIPWQDGQDANRLIACQRSRRNVLLLAITITGKFGSIPS